MHLTRKIAGISIEKEEVKLCLFTDDINASISTEKLQLENLPR